MLRFLSDAEKEKTQRRGYMCEHLLCWYSMTSDKTALWDEDFPVYFSGYGEVDFILFGLSGREVNRLACVRELLKLPIRELNIVSPEALNGLAGVETLYTDWDYHIDMEHFDLDLKGRKYRDIRYNVKRVDKMGYHVKTGREFTRSHTYIVSRHMARHSLDIWDFEELLSVERFFREHSHGFMMEAYRGDRLIGFDVVDFFEETGMMVVPLGVYLEEPRLADFLMWENLKYAKDKGYRWLDVGLSCRNVGLQEFKRKWLAEPKYKLSVQTIELSG